jgi:putative aminopeptidase FrvX
VQQGSIEFLKRLLDTPAPSGFEAAAARVWREEAASFADGVEADVSGNSIAILNGDGSPRIMLAGHIDEIGVMITHVDDDGFLYFEGIGGWDSQVLVGQRIRLLARSGDVLGVIGKKPIHLIKRDDRDKVSKVEDLWIDIGAKDRDAVVARGVRVGDPGVIDARMLELGDGLIASRSIDNRIGAYVVLEALRLLSASRPAAMVAAVATAQEEIGFAGGGARTSAYALRPQIGLVVDVTFASDAPGIEKKEVGDHKLGSGPVITRGSATHTVLVDRLVETAEAESIPYTLTAAPRFTATDADAIYLSRAGVATAVISVPNRYMHSPNEIVALSDLDAAARLIAAFCQTVGPNDNWVP